MNGNTPYEFRTTVVKEFHTKEDFISIGQWLAGAKLYFLQSFVDSGDLFPLGFTAIPKTNYAAFKA